MNKYYIRRDLIKSLKIIKSTKFIADSDLKGIFMALRHLCDQSNNNFLALIMCFATISNK